jgi:hypothetical protein
MVGEEVMTEKERLVARLFDLRNSDAYLQDHPVAVKEAAELRKAIRIHDVANMSPGERARAAIDARSAPTQEELDGTAPWLQQTVSV